MLGSIRWNLVLGLTGMLLTFFFSLGNNGFVVSCIRAVYAFAAFFAAGWLLRGALQLIVASNEAERVLMAAEEARETGAHVDLRTPDDAAELGEMLKAQRDNGRPSDPAAEFRPLEPKRLFSIEGKNPEELADAVRHLARDGDN
ncbi:MAG: hypothetical protein A9Z00_05150 [Thermobacillus sp. ZCTH02-B1]|uniref:hypothetical protein n=1 Tax=Thermobacillus sp. ZCTH02-B1 TaxID=1858795 RepID=UPI000B559FDC|nr:hypothetical protein [Thermobacillus sp. ZCTH02-B1]OUM96957.1 MAG: hypothetical protein A9Z00_05150 [Thermobacillus sp. ZCTH02-B1]